jgi:glycosyltransferase involved in cell wall biosynthesis
VCRSCPPNPRRRCRARVEPIIPWRAKEPATVPSPDAATIGTCPVRRYFHRRTTRRPHLSDEGISAVVPVYNLLAFVGEAVASIQAQTRPVQEIILVDDGSTDGTRAAAEAMARQDPRIRIVDSQRRGPSGARNLGLRAAGCAVIAFLDGDDLWPRDKIELQARRLASADRPDVVSGLVQCFSAVDAATGEPLPGPTPAVTGPYLGAALFRRLVFERVGPFDETLTYSEDQDLLLRIREAGLKLVILRRTTLYYRQRPGSMMDAAAAPKDYQLLEVLRRSVARRRRHGGAADLGPLSDLLDP